MKVPNFEHTQRLSADDRKPYVGSEWLARASGRPQFDVEGANDSTLRGLSFTKLQEAKIPERQPILLRNGEPLFRQRQIIQIFADRGTGKSLFVRTLALVMSGKGEAMGFSSPGAFRVVYFDGEMAADEIQSRDAMLATCTSSVRQSTLLTIAADWQDEPMPRLDTDEGQEAADPFVAWADVVILDNRSCLFNAAGERDPIVWADAQRWILDLRRRGKMVILVHHAGKSGQMRGISNAEDAMDYCVELARPEDYDAAQGARFEMRFTKNRISGPVVEPMTVHLTPSGWEVEASGDAALTTLEQKILQTVDEGEYKTRTDIQQAVKGSTKKFYDAFERLEERDLVHQVSRKGKGYTGKSYKVWAVNLEVAATVGFTSRTEKDGK